MKGQTQLNFNQFHGINLSVLEFKTWFLDTYYLQILIVKYLKPYFATVPNYFFFGNQQSS